MSLLLASAAMTAAAMIPACSWNTPGRHPYRGTAMEAVSRYVDIPAATRSRLAARIGAGSADDDVIITRDAVEGRHGYHPAITGMHFGRRTVCEEVARERWSATAREPAKVYCEDGHCLIVPRICGNISRIRRSAAGGAPAGAAGPRAGVQAGGYIPRGGSIPLPAGAPEADIELADAMAQLVAGPAAAPAPPRAPGFPLGGWAPGTGIGALPNASLPAAVPALPVPEPAGWMMLLAGAACLVLSSRLRA
jgi:hypothetical protein